MDKSGKDLGRVKYKQGSPWILAPEASWIFILRGHVSGGQFVGGLPCHSQNKYRAHRGLIGGIRL